MRRKLVLLSGLGVEESLSVDVLSSSSWYHSKKLFFSMANLCNISSFAGEMSAGGTLFSGGTRSTL